MTQPSQSAHSTSPFDLPPQWRAMKLKYIAGVQLSNVDKKSLEGETPVRLCNYVDVYKNDYITDDMEFMEATATDGQIARFGLKCGDVLITKDSEDWRDIAVPALVSADLPGVLCGYHLAHVRPDTKQILGRFLFRAFNAPGIADQFRVSAHGVTRFGLGKDEITGAIFPVPPLDEQQAIANFLDRKTAQIDGLIAKKRRMIELLQEKRLALISEAVSVGIEQDVPLVDTGHPVFRAIPKHWHFTKNKLLFREIDIRSENGEGDLMTVSHLTGVRPRSENPDVTMFLAETNENYKECQRDDVVINTMWAFMGALGVTRQDGLVSPSYNVYRIKRDIHPAYYDLLCRTPTYKTEILRHSKGIWTSRLRLYPEAFLGMYSPLPPLDEQKRIVESVATRTREIGVMQLALTNAITKLLEYRQTLVSAAVTGQIRMKGFGEAIGELSTKPATKPNPYFRRTVLAAEIIDKLWAEPTFGHVKFQKCLFVAQYHLQLADFEENYKRAAAGPYDNQMIRSVESQLQKQKWFRVEQTGDRYVYKRMDRAGDHKKYFEGYFGDKADQLNSLIDLLKPLDTDRAEIVATLYAVWNDFLLLNEPFDDDRIVQEVLTNWDESKKRFPEDRWKKALGWMRDKGLVPTGFGKPTISNPTKSARGK